MEVDGDKFACRRWGNASSSQPPLFFVQHFGGGMDHWDPLLTDGLATGREVILFNSRGIASSSGTPRNRIEDMADDIALVIQALGLSQVDLLGFSLGGFQVQEVALRHPQLVRKLLLLGTGPRGGRRPRRAVPVPRALPQSRHPVPGGVTTRTSTEYLRHGHRSHAICTRREVPTHQLADYLTSTTTSAEQLARLDQVSNPDATSLTRGPVPPFARFR